MSNKIQSGPITPYAAANGVSRSRAPSSASGVASSPARIASDSLQLSGDAALLQEASSAALNASGIDAQQVADVRQALRNGSYQINPQLIASKMMKMDWGARRLVNEPLPYARITSLASPLAQRVQDNLQAQLDCTQQLLDLLREERGALIGGDVGQLERLTQTKAQAAGLLQTLGKTLLQLRGNVRGGFDAWIASLHSNALIAQWRELLQRAEHCRRDNDSNAALLASREAQLRDTLRALRPVDTAEVYGRRGHYQLGLPGRSFGTA